MDPRSPIRSRTSFAGVTDLEAFYGIIKLISSTLFQVNHIDPEAHKYQRKNQGKGQRLAEEDNA